MTFKKYNPKNTTLSDSENFISIGLLLFTTKIKLVELIFQNLQFISMQPKIEMKLMNSKRDWKALFSMINRTQPQIQPQLGKIWIEPHPQNKELNPGVALKPIQ